MAMSTRNDASPRGVGVTRVSAELIMTGITFSMEEQGGAAQVGRAVTRDATTGKFGLSASNDRVDGRLAVVERDGYGTVEVTGYVLLPFGDATAPTIGELVEGYTHGVSAANGYVRTDNTNGRHRVVDTPAVNVTGDCPAGYVLVHLDAQ